MVSRAEYLGFGPLESYSDKHEAAWWGRFSESIDACFEAHIKPQESGAHTGCTSLMVRTDDRRGLSVSADQPFSFYILKNGESPELLFWGQIVN